jgi:hypothetical protein
VIDILDELKILADVPVFRYRGQVDFRTLRVEIFRGHGFTRTIQNFSVTKEQARDSQRYFKQDDILACCCNTIISLRPLIYFREDTSGQVAKLCMFRKAHGELPDRLLEYEVVGEATRWDVNRTVFKSEMDELRALFGLCPD